MYLPRHFEENRPAQLQALVHEHPLGLLVTHGTGGLDSNPLPWLLDTEADGSFTLRGHVARANPVWQAGRAEGEVLVVFQGAQAYISPSGYPGKADHGKVVPTWNYLMVQVRGSLRVVDDPVWLLDLVSRLTRQQEADQPQPWAVSDAPADYTQQMLRAIVGVEVPVKQWLGKWKLSQNRSAADRQGLVASLLERGDAASLALAEQMHKPEPGQDPTAAR